MHAPNSSNFTTVTCSLLVQTILLNFGVFFALSDDTDLFLMKVASFSPLYTSLSFKKLLLFQKFISFILNVTILIVSLAIP